MSIESVRRSKLENTNARVPIWKRAEINIMNYSKLSSDTGALSSRRWLFTAGSPSTRNSVTLNKCKVLSLKRE